jgi:hypothetical protein
VVNLKGGRQMSEILRRGIDPTGGLDPVAELPTSSTTVQIRRETATSSATSSKEPF